MSEFLRALMGPFLSPNPRLRLKHQRLESEGANRLGSTMHEDQYVA